MYVVCVTVFVQPAKVQEFIAASLDNARNSRQEPGNLRFDFLQAEDDPARFMIYEAYRAKEDFAAHQQTPHYLRWKQTVADWMSQPRQGVRHKSLFFENSLQ
jgi:(4S)-4-hydroxy-5-phosphonooxypentane-2,3-dione isomerase